MLAPSDFDFTEFDPNVIGLLPGHVSHCEMNWKFANAVFASVCLMTGGWITFATMARAQAKPVVFTTTPKPVNTRLQFSDGSSFAVRGRASLTVTAANEDDTLTGTLLYVLPEDARKKIAQMASKTLNDVPSNVTMKDVSANFRHGTACPLMRLEVSVKEAEINGARGAKLRFDRVALDIQETPAQINQLFCSWTRQINAKRQRHGLIAAINRMIQPEGLEEGAEKTVR